MSVMFLLYWELLTQLGVLHTNSCALTLIYVGVCICTTDFTRLFETLRHKQMCDNATLSNRKQKVCENICQLACFYLLVRLEPYTLFLATGCVCITP